MLFKNEKPKHITFALKDFSKRLPIVDEFNDDDNKESFVFKSTNLSRKIRLKPINHNGIINNDDNDFDLPIIGNRASLKSLSIIPPNIVEETEKQVQKKFLKHTMKDIKKSIKININIENININKNTVFIRGEEEKERRAKVMKIDNSKFIMIVNNFNRLKRKPLVLNIVKELKINKNRSILLMYLKGKNIGSNGLKFLNNILNLKTSLDKKRFNNMFNLIKLYISIFIYNKRKFVKRLKEIQIIFQEKLNMNSILIQRVFKGFSFRKKNRYINEENRKRKVAIITIQKRTRGMKRNSELMFSFKEFKRIQQMKKEYLIQRKLVLRQTEAVRVIENFWSGILERRDDEKLDQQIANMPEECKNLYKKFVNLRKQTNNLKKDLVKIGMKK